MMRPPTCYLVELQEVLWRQILGIGRNSELYEVLLLTVEKAVNKMVSEGKTYKKSVAA
jgi:hypothetical protein